MNISDLLSPSPKQWGYRGDPHLYAELAKKLANRSLPEDLSSLREILEVELNNITGQDFASTDEFFMDRYAIGSGMSDGMISSEFWRNQLIPMILDRFNKAQKR